MSGFDVPIVLILFKRKDSALRILQRIRQVAPSRLYLISDEGRHDAEKRLVREVRAAVEGAIDWPCEVVKNYATENRGVYSNIALGAKWVFQRESEAIFLEDDNLPEVSFFEFCRTLLRKYENDTRVLWVCGTNYLGEYSPADGASYMFTRHLLPCGWASWAKQFNRFYDFELASFTLDSIAKVRHEYDDHRLYRQQIFSIQEERNRAIRGLPYSSWDFHMAWSIRVNGLLGISPAMNQIRNIGVDEYSIHGGTSMEMEMTNRFCGMDSYFLESPLVHPKVVLPDPKFEALTGAVILLPMRVRVRLAVRRWAGRLFGLDPELSIKKLLSSRLRGSKSAGSKPGSNEICATRDHDDR